MTGVAGLTVICIGGHDHRAVCPLRKDHPLAEIEVLQGEGMAYPVEDE